MGISDVIWRGEPIEHISSVWTIGAAIRYRLWLDLWHRYHIDSNTVAGIFNNITASAPLGSLGHLEFGNTTGFCGPRLGLEADCLMCKGDLMCNMYLNLKAQNLRKLELFGDGHGVACPPARVLTCCLSSPALPITTKIIAIAEGGRVNSTNDCTYIV